MAQLPEQAAAGLWTTPSDLTKYNIGVYNVLTLRYVLIPGIGNYYLEFIRDGEKLFVIDSIAEEKLQMGVLDSLHLIDLENGDEIVFSPNGDTPSFTWGNRFRFNKVDE